MEATFLGVILDEHLTWKSHISYVARKVFKAIGIIVNQVFALIIPPYGHIPEEKKTVVVGLDLGQPDCTPCMRAYYDFTYRQYLFAVLRSRSRPPAIDSLQIKEGHYLYVVFGIFNLIQPAVSSVFGRFGQSA